MRRSRWAKGSRRVLLAASLALALSGCSAHDVEKRLRFGWPTGVTRQGEEMRVLWTWSGVTALIVGIGVWGLIFWCCLRYRPRDAHGLVPRQTKYNLPLEIIYSIIPFLIIGGLFYRTVVVENDVNKVTSNPDVRIQVDAFKWNWQFEYHEYKDSAGSMRQAVYPGRTDATDPTGKAPLHLSTVGSDSEIPVLVLPVNERVRVVEHSLDVVHSFWVPQFLFKRDVLPYGAPTSVTARDNQFEFTPTSTGSFVGRCAELCGTYHSQMNFEVRVVSAAQFQSYVQALSAIGPDDPARQAEALKAAGMGPVATTTHPFNTDRSANSPTLGS